VLLKISIKKTQIIKINQYYKQVNLYAIPKATKKWRPGMKIKLIYRIHLFQKIILLSPGSVYVMNVFIVSGCV